MIEKGRGFKKLSVGGRGFNFILMEQEEGDRGEKFEEVYSKRVRIKENKDINQN